MRRLLLGLLALLPLEVPAQAQLLPQGPVGVAYCTKSVFGQITGVQAATTIIAGVAGQQIYICGTNLDTTTGTQTFQLVYGTGTNCATGQVAATTTYTIPANANIVDHIPYAAISVPAGNSVCSVTTTATNVLQWTVYYGQF